MATTYYVYVLARPNGKAFYVGKGKGKRIYDHEYEAKRGCKCHKCNVIRKIWRNGGEVQRYTVFTTEDEMEAYTYEAELITLYGKESLTNCVDGGSGGSNPSKESLARMSAASRARWSDPEFRAREITKLHERLSEPGARDKVVARMRAKWADLEWRAKVIENSKANWEDPELRAQMAANSRAAKAKPEVREKQRAAGKAHWERPGYREAHQRAAAIRYSDPLQHERQRKNALAQWSDPALRLQVSMKQRKLSPEAEREICRRRAAGETRSVLAQEYGVDPATITNIMKRNKSEAA